MDKETALLIKNSLIGGVREDQYTFKANNPLAHSVFLILANSRGNKSHSGVIDNESFMQILRDCADALTNKEKE